MYAFELKGSLWVKQVEKGEIELENKVLVRGIKSAKLTEKQNHSKTPSALGLLNPPCLAPALTCREKQDLHNTMPASHHVSLTLRWCLEDLQ